MPAIVLARLRQQASLLAGHFDQPAAFVRSLHHLLELYADRTHRPGQSGVPAPLLAAYNVPQPVLRQILTELAPLADADGQEALDLCDALWAGEILEFRLLAASLLGLVPPVLPGPVLSRVEAWARISKKEERMISAVLTQGLSRLRQERPETVLQLVEGWLGDPDPDLQKLGLRALRPLLSTPIFENLPIFFRLVNPFVRNAPLALQPDIIEVLNALAQLSPRETSHYLRQNLDLGRDTAWLIRQCLPQFPPEIQESLRAVIRVSDRRKA